MENGVSKATSGKRREIDIHEKDRVLILLVTASVFFSGCVTANPNSEVMVDTSAKSKKNVPDGASQPGDFDRMADPFLVGGN